MLAGVGTCPALGRLPVRPVETVGKGVTNVARQRNKRQLLITFGRKHEKSASSQKSLDTLDLLLNSSDASPGAPTIS